MTTDYYDAADGAEDDFQDALHDWCEANDRDPEDPEAIEAFEDQRAFDADPYAYYGLSRWDFL